MNRIKLITAVLLIFAGGAVYAQTAVLPVYSCENPGVNALTSGLKSTNFLQGIVPSCTVTVYLTGTITVATIYKDASNTPQNNPFTANSNGSIPPIYASTGQAYDVLLSGGFPPNIYLSPITLTGLQGGGGGGGGGISSITPGANTTCTPFVGGTCVGAVTINSTGSGSGITIQTNNNPNALQTILNFASGNGFVFSNPSGGVEALGVDASHILPVAGGSGSTALFLNQFGTYTTPAGGGNVTAGATLTSGKCVYGQGTFAIAVDSSCLDDGAGNLTMQSLTLLGATPGSESFVAGTGSIPALAANSAGFAAPVAFGTPYLFKLPATITAGVLHAGTPGTGDGVNESALTSSLVALSDLGTTGTASTATWLRGDYAWTALPIATSSILGIGRPDNSSITVSGGIWSAVAAPAPCPEATCILKNPTLNAVITQPSHTNFGTQFTDWGANPIFTYSFANGTDGNFANNYLDFTGSTLQLFGLENKTVVFNFPGFSWNALGTTWATMANQYFQTTKYSRGILDTITNITTSYAPDDVNAIVNQIESHGGCITSADECTTPYYMTVTEGSPANGTVVSGGTTGSNSITVTLDQGVGNGRMIVDTTATTGVITTTQSGATGVAVGNGMISKVTLGTTVTASYCGNVTANVNTPRIPGPGTTTMTITMTPETGVGYSGSATAIATSGGSSFIDTFNLVSIGSFSGGIQTFTAGLRRPILSGAKMCVGGLASYGQLNTTSADGGYYFQVIGSPDTTHAYLAMENQGVIGAPAPAGTSTVTFTRIATVEGTVLGGGTNTYTLGSNIIAFANGDTIYVPNDPSQIYRLDRENVTGQNHYAQFSGRQSAYSGAELWGGNNAFNSITGFNDPTKLSAFGGKGVGFAIDDIILYAGMGQNWHNPPTSGFYSGNVYPNSITTVGCDNPTYCGSFYLYFDNSGLGGKANILIDQRTNTFNFQSGGGGAAVVKNGGVPLMTNPMTTLGDQITGAASGVPQRVAVGSNGNIWTVVSGVPAWAAPATAGTVTNIATSGPITGGPITSTGTIGCATCGVTGSPLSQFASTTSAQLLGVLSDETGTGFAVFSASPTFTGVPLAPTATVGTNTTQIATTAFVLANAGGSPAFSAVTAGTNTNALLMGAGGSLGRTGGGTIDASTLLGNTWASPAAIGTGTPAAGTFTTLTATSGTFTGTTPGATSWTAGTGSITALPANSAGFAGPATGGTSYLIKFPATMTAGLAHFAATATGDGVLESVLTSSLVAIADLSATGTPSSTTFLRGDNTWATPAGSGTVTSIGTTGPIGGGTITTTGTITCTTCVVATSPGIGLAHFAGSTQTVTSSLVAIADLSATGTPSSTTYLRGDNTWATVAGGSSALSAITAASGANTIANGNNGLQIWNWAATTNQNQFQFGETTAATSGTLGSQYILSAKTLAGSTAVPLGVICSLTGSQTLPCVHITPTWNTSGVVDAALLVNVTNTASGTGSLLIDLQVGAVSQFSVDKAGAGVFKTSSATIGSGSGSSYLGVSGTAVSATGLPTNYAGWLGPASGTPNFQAQFPTTAPSAQCLVQWGTTASNISPMTCSATFAATFTAPAYATSTNCSSSASPAVCGSAASGSITIAASATTVTVNTTAITANSQIYIQPDETLSTKLGVTCNSTLSSLSQPVVTARTAGTSFQITTGGTIVSNPACYSYTIIN